ncbi:hypothetical protein [Pseudoxanthomonas suwonensis]|uniref:Uncharacterized protein n=1 Tax=Pseudoxanthomonas suwonensis TaxID=314722 RepID=A0A0E3UPP2_9GAMM|nr:hypothetical protein [Pseudoxanthomonas suwonensis]AKC88010.1 hypothetical protein WQ53_15785 [Pseudoxanthomonas suwonensis]
MQPRSLPTASTARPRLHHAGAFARAGSATAMEDEQQAPALRPVDAAAPGGIEGAGEAPVGKAALLRLEQLALRELAAARPLASAGQDPADTLLACIRWDLDSPVR